MHSDKFGTRSTISSNGAILVAIHQILQNEIDFEGFKVKISVCFSLPRYKDGTDYMGEHRDDEKELVPTSPIASLSLGQPRDFIFRHGESRGKNAKRNLPPVKITLEHGSLLMMNYPTNVFP